MKLLSLFALMAPAFPSISALRFTNSNFNNITTGKPFNLTWSDASGPVEIRLLKGATPAFFASAGVIASKFTWLRIDLCHSGIGCWTTLLTLSGNLTSTSHLWTPSTDLYRDVYDIMFKDSTGIPVYGFQFEILGGRVTGTSTLSSSSSTTSAAPSYTATFAYPPSGSLRGS